MDKKISIITANYNGEKYLESTIISVLEQNYKNIEYIIVDDGSTDRSEQIIKKFKDDRIKTRFLDKNQHIVNALNIGLDMSGGDYIARIDTGDIFEKDKLKKQIEFMETNKEYGACFSWCNLIDGNGNNVNNKYWQLDGLYSCENRTQKGWIDFFINAGNCLIHPSVLMRKSVIDEVGKYSLAYVQAQDMELWFRIVLKYPIYVMPERLVKIREEESGDRISKGNDLTDTRFFNEHSTMINNIVVNYKTDIAKHYLETEVKDNLEYKCAVINKLAGERSKQLKYKLITEALKDNKGLKALQEKCNIGLLDFYKMNCEHVYFDDVTHRLIENNKREIESNKREIESKNHELERKEKQIEEYVVWLADKESDLNAKESNIKMLEETVLSRNEELFRIKHSKTMKVANILKSVNIFRDKSNTPKPRFFMLASHDFGNLGDHVILKTMRTFLNDCFKGYDIIEISVRNYPKLRAQMIAGIGQNDYIILPGGGSLGNEYMPWSENMVRDIMHNFKHNKIIIFPQTIYFTNDQEGKLEKQNTSNIYNSCDDLTICLRDKQSYKKAKEMFNCKLMLIPDTVLYTKKAYEPKVKERYDKGLLILRGDQESVMQDKVKNEIKNICLKKASSVEHENTQKDYFIDIKDREQEINKFMDKVARYKFIVTDRLHGMVISAITQTPCVAFDNHSSKVSGTYEFIKYLPYIKFADNIEKLNEALDEVLSVENPVYTNEPLREYYDKLAQAFGLF